MAIKVSGTTVIDDSRNLQNSTNLNATGNVYANTFIGDGSQLTNLPPSGGTITATASGTLADGSAVVVNADGTVSTISGTVYTQSVGSHNDFSSPASGTSNIEFVHGVAYSPDDNKIVLLYSSRSSTALEAVVGTISGTSISYGTPLTIEGNKFIIVFSHDNANKGVAVAGTISGTSFSKGTSETFQSSTTVYELSCVYDATAERVLVHYTYATNSNYGTLIALAADSGGNISIAASATLYTSTAISGHGLSYDSDQGVCVVAYKASNVNYPQYKVVEISGSSFNLGTAVAESDQQVNTTSRNGTIAYDASAQKHLAVWSDTSDKLWFRSLSVSGSSITLGGTAQGDNTRADNRYRYATAFYDSFAQLIIFALLENNNSLNIMPIDMSGSSPSIGTVTTQGESVIYTTGMGGAFIGGGQSVFAAREGSGGQLAAVVFTSPAVETNLTSSNYLGISNGAYANNTTATIQVAGAVDDAQSSLTPGQQYFVQAVGSIGTTASSPSVVAGTAVAATKLLVKG